MTAKDHDNVVYTHTEAQAINDFIERVLARCYKYGDSLGHTVQLELDIMHEQIGTKQGFPRILHIMVGEDMDCVGLNYEIGYL